MRLEPEDEWRPKGIDELEPVAWEALRHEASACVVAGPGAGKTEFLAQRADYLLSTGLCRRPRQILAITFKRDAARNLANRVGARTSQGAPRFQAMTFDAFTKGLVDRFREALPGRWALRDDYELVFPTRRTVETFLEDVAEEDPQWRKEIHAIPRQMFLPVSVGSYSLPVEVGSPQSGEEFAVQRWWAAAYDQASPQSVDFVMLNRLAELIIRHTPQIQRALQRTYPFVFVDEFQDTTYAQYSFLRAVFGETSTTVTAVGDDKQKIMGWAGALGDAFQEFRLDFHATSFELERNFRSSDELIHVQHVVAQTLDPNAKRAVSAIESSIDGPAAEIWTFNRPIEEAAYIADWIADDVAESGRSPSDYALLARQRAADFEPLMEQEFLRVGLRLRNDDRVVGNLRLQDLLADDLTSLMLRLMRLASTDGGNASVWTQVCESMPDLHGMHGVDDDGAATERRLEEFVRATRAWMRDHAPSPESADELVGRLMEYISVDAVRRTFPHHRTLAYVNVAVEAFSDRINQVLADDLTWMALCDEFEGADAVPLMTVHKSKGLEFHTVLFLGIDDHQWWSFAREPEASLATFFVGLSRARQRTVFTYCAARGNRRKVDDLYALLDSAGVLERNL